MTTSFLVGEIKKTETQTGDCRCEKCGGYACKYVPEEQLKKESCPNCGRVGTLFFVRKK